jgi:hypothetical protein
MEAVRTSEKSVYFNETTWHSQKAAIFTIMNLRVAQLAGNFLAS